MITEKLYETDGKLTVFNAAVVKAAEIGGKYAAILDRTAFAPEGGGQPADTGNIDGIPVTDVQVSGDEILHFTEAPLKEGTKVTCAIDAARRLRHMQNHTGEHILCGIIHKRFGFDNVGFHLGKTDVTLDINGVLTDTQLIEIEKAANAAVYENRAVTVMFPDAAEAALIPFRSKKEITSSLRLICIDGVDVCACCAPHVARTGEIGIIKIISAEHYKGGMRIHIKCGGDALEDYSRRLKSSEHIGELLKSPSLDCATAVDKLHEKLQEAKYEHAKLKAEYIKLFVTSLNGNCSTPAFFNDFDTADLIKAAEEIWAKHGSGAAFSKSGDGFLFACKPAAENFDAVCGALRKELKCRCGGKDMITGFCPTGQAEITAFFKDINK